MGSARGEYDATAVARSYWPRISPSQMSGWVWHLPDVAEPMDSGRNWSEDPEGNFRAEQGVHEIRWLRDDDDRRAKAIFKALKGGVDAIGLYSMAMERVY